MTPPPPTDSDSGDAVSPPVIISFAEADAPTVAEAATALQARGHRVALVPGIEQDADELTRVIDSHEGQGLYVLCRSSSLPRDSIDQLRALLRAHGVPFGRTLTLAVETKRARALEERIVSVLKRMVTGRGALPRPVVPVPTPPPELDEETDTMIRPPGDSSKIAVAVAGNTQIGPAPLGPAPAETESVHSDEIAAWADSLVGRAPTDLSPGDSGPWPTPGEPAPPELADLALSPEMSDPNAATARIEPGGFEASAPDYAGVNTTQVAPPAPAPSDDIADFPKVPVQTNLTLKTPALPRDGGLAVDLDANSQEATALEDDFEDVSFTPGGKFTRALGGPKGFALVVGGLVVVALLAVGISMMGGDDEPKVASQPDTKAAADADAKAAEDDDDEDDEEQDEGEDDDGNEDGGDDEDDDAADTPEPAADDGSMPTQIPDPPKPGGEDPVAPTPVPAVTPTADVASDRPPPPEPDDVVPPDPAKIAATPGPGEKVIAAALRDREVRALDIFIVSDDGAEGSFDSASRYCEDLEVAGIGGWKLPTAGELNSLGAAKLVSKGVYWSRTLGDMFGDTRLVLNASKDRLSAAPTSWTGATPICIRPRS